MKKKRNNRAAGHRFELECVHVMKKLGFKKACSSRLESRALDAAKVDICFTDPFNIQCKFTIKQPSFRNILNAMPKGSNFNLIFHRMPRQKTTVTMGIECFEYLIKKANILEAAEPFEDEMKKCDGCNECLDGCDCAQKCDK